MTRAVLLMFLALCFTRVSLVRAVHPVVATCEHGKPTVPAVLAGPGAVQLVCPKNSALQPPPPHQQAPQQARAFAVPNGKEPVVLRELLPGAALTRANDRDALEVAQLPAAAVSVFFQCKGGGVDCEIQVDVAASNRLGPNICALVKSKILFDVQKAGEEVLFHCGYNMQLSPASATKALDETCSKEVDLPPDVTLTPADDSFNKLTVSKLPSAPTKVCYACKENAAKQDEACLVLISIAKNDEPNGGAPSLDVAARSACALGVAAVVADRESILYGTGAAVVMRNLASNHQVFLHGHDSTVTSIALSPTGRYLASGQHTHKGFVADVILWDLKCHQEKQRLRLHKDSIQDISFSCGERYLATLGAKDANDLVIWDVARATAICGASAPGGPATCIRFFNRSETHLLTAGFFHVRIWHLDSRSKKLKMNECNLGKLRRIIQCVHITSDDATAYCGTSSGDILEIVLERGLLKRAGPVSSLLPQGVTSIAQLPDQTLLVGTGQGVVAHLSDLLVVKGVCNVFGGVTATIVSPNPRYIFVGTRAGSLYSIDVDSLTPKLRLTSHTHGIRGVVFPEAASNIFATASVNDLRVWDARTCRELMRFGLPEVECFCIAFMPDGSSIISGWSDGAIRVLLPESGRTLSIINHAHRDGATAIAATHESKRVISGGMAGDVRVWSVDGEIPRMLASLKEHRGRVTSLQLRKSDTHAITASADGSVILWDLNNYTSVLSISETTIFKAIAFHHDEIHLLATGSDRKVHFIDTSDGVEMRALDASESGDVNCLAVTNDGKYFLSGGDDKVLKLWNFETGECEWTGVAHADSITCCAISPDQRTIITADDKGALYFWKFPEL